MPTRLGPLYGKVWTGRRGMEQSVAVLNTLILQSPLSVDECRAAQESHDQASSMGSVDPSHWLWRCPEVNGTIGWRRVRLIRPHATNTSCPELVGTLDAGQDGGTIFMARIRYTFGWARPSGRNDEDLDYLIDGVARIARSPRSEVRSAPAPNDPYSGSKPPAGSDAISGRQRDILGGWALRRIAPTSC